MKYTGIKDGFVYLKDDSGQWVLPDSDDTEEYLRQGKVLLPLCVDGKWGYTDGLTGEVVIKPQWDYCAGALHGDEYALVNSGGTVYWKGLVYCEGGKQVGGADETGLGTTSCIGGKFGYIDRKGKVVIPLEYDAALHPFMGNVNKNKKWGVINDQNQIVIPFKYDNLIRPQHDDSLKWNGAWMVDSLK